MVTPVMGPQNELLGQLARHWTAFCTSALILVQGALEGGGRAVNLKAQWFSLALTEPEDQVKASWAGLHSSAPLGLCDSH